MLKILTACKSLQGLDYFAAEGWKHLMISWWLLTRWLFRKGKERKMMNGMWNEWYMNCGYEIKWSYDLRSYERNFCNCVEKPEKFRTSTGFEPWTFQASLRNCKNCVHNCEDSLLHLISYPQFIYDSFHISFIIDSFLTGSLEPTNDQLPTSVAS